MTCLDCNRRDACLVIANGGTIPDCGLHSGSGAKDGREEVGGRDVSADPGSPQIVASTQAKEGGMRHIYVAGPYSTDPGQNVHNATRAATELLDAGLRPYLPHLTHFWNASFPRDYEVWMALDLAWLGKCEALVRLPGHSPGADREEAEAKRIGIPVFASTREAIEWAAPKPRAVALRCDACGWHGWLGQFWVNRETGERLCYGCVLAHDRKWHETHKTLSPIEKEHGAEHKGCGREAA